ncbi:hypothetical protein [Acidovorax sp. LjRoot194]|uniref:hypothetical protein n=1 Tax=Acidovorax sp. LjRoot194 TaxID=3342280 RepID=UPI003F4FE988
MRAGNAPVIVNRRERAVHALETAHPANIYLKEYALLHQQGSISNFAPGKRRKLIFHQINTMKIALLILSLLLTGCAAPKRFYIYDQPDAATIVLSQTSDFSMSKVVLWGMQMDQVEPNRDEKLGPFAFPVSTRIYRHSSAEKQFIIYDTNEYGIVHQSFKMPPGKYKISAINVQRVSGTGPEAMSLTAMVDAGRPKGLFSSQDLRTFPKIFVDLKPGSVNYIGNFRAHLDNCNNILTLCGEYRIEVRDRFARDIDLLKIESQDTKTIVNETIMIDRKSSPYFYRAD